MRVYCYVLVALFAFFLPSAVYAQSEISVDVEMDEYSLGDHDLRFQSYFKRVTLSV